MAIKKEIEIIVDSADAKKAVDELTKSNTDLTASFEDVYGELKPLTARMGELEDRMYELALAGKTNTQEYKDLQKEVSKYKKTIIETDTAVDALATTTGGKMSGALNAAASGFQVYEAGLGLIGVESEAVQESLLKVQSAMALADGIAQIQKEGIPAIKAFGGAFKNMLQGVKGAVAATGIGLLIVALGTIYTYWDDIKGAVSGVSDEQEKLNKKAEQNLNIEKSKLDKLNGQDNTLKLQGLSERQILQLKLKQTDEIIKASEIQIKQSLNTAKAQEKAAARNKEILKGIIEFTTIPLQFILGTVDKVAKVLGKDLNLRGKLNDWAASLVFDPKEVKMEGYKVYKEQHDALEKIKNDRAGLQLQINAIDKQAHDERIRLQKEANAKSKELADAKNKQDLEDAKNEEAFLQSARARNTAFNEDIKEKEDDVVQAKKKAWSDYLEFVKNNNTQEVEEESKKQKALRLLRENGVQGVQDTLSIISNLTELFAGKSKKAQERAFKIQKAVNIASAIVDTYKAANAALASAPPPFNFIAMGAAITAGLVNVKKIASTKFEGGSTPSASGGGGSFSSSMGGSTEKTGNVIAPNFNIVGAGGANQLGSLAPIQAYVVSSEMTSQQALDRNRMRNATF